MPVLGEGLMSLGSKGRPHGRYLGLYFGADRRVVAAAWNHPSGESFPRTRAADNIWQSPSGRPATFVQGLNEGCATFGQKKSEMAEICALTER